MRQKNLFFFMLFSISINRNIVIKNYQNPAFFLPFHFLWLIIADKRN